MYNRGVYNRGVDGGGGDSGGVDDRGVPDSPGLATSPSGRPLQARARATRQALLDAALECLVELGYAATSTTEVARRAGVSRGAQLHHFPTKQELLAAALDHLLERRVDEYRKAFSQLATGVDRRDAAIDLLWRMYDGDSFVAWAELWVAARTDADLRAVLLDVDRKLDEATAAVYREVLPPGPDDDPALANLGRVFAFALMDGLAFHRMVRDHYGGLSADDMVDALKYVSGLVYPSAQAHPTREVQP